MDDTLAKQFNVKYARQGLVCSVMDQGHLVVKMGHSFQGLDAIVQHLMDSGAYRVDREGDNLTVWVGVNDARHTIESRTINPFIVAILLIVAVVVSAFWTQIHNTIEMYST